MRSHVDQVQSLLSVKGADAALITFLPDIRWSVGFTGSSGVLVVLRSEAHFVTDGRYASQARQEVKGATVHIPGYKLMEHIQERNLFGDSSEVLCQADQLSLSDYNDLEKHFPSIHWRPEKELLVERVAAKERWEIDAIRHSQRITEEVFDHILPDLKPGVSEKEIAAEIVYQHMLRGAQKMSFDPIVASGANGALPHAHPTSRKIESGDLIVLDFGCFADGYASDMTRTVAVGQPSAEAREAYRVVLHAQSAAIERAQAHVPSNELDAVARKVVERAGLGQFFPHSLGHGVGLQIHEWPKVSYLSEEPLPASCAVTIEPGVYVPDQFGIRIEDIVVLQHGGCEVITRAPKELIIL